MLNSTSFGVGEPGLFCKGAIVGSLFCHMPMICICTRWLNC